MHIVIVGGSLAGANAAVGLRDEGHDGPITILGAEPEPPFGRPPLSKTYLRGVEADLSAWQAKPLEWYAAHDIELRSENPVRGVDPPNRRVMLEDGTDIACDRILVATGCRPRRPQLPGIDLEGVLTLRTRPDADAIRAYATQPGAGALVVGMGFIGSEVAATLRQLDVDVTAIDFGSGPLARALGPEMARRMAVIHRANGVELLSGERVAEFRGAGAVESVVTQSGREIECTFAVVGLGVLPNTDALDGSGVEVDDGVLVDATCKTNVDGIYAAGDVARHDHPVFGHIRVEHYNNAEKQGRHAARTILGRREPYDYIHSFWSDQYDHKIEHVGHAATWDQFVMRQDSEGHAVLGFYLSDGVLVAAAGLDRGGDPEAEPDSELAVCAELIGRRARVDPRVLAHDDLRGLR